MPELASPSSTRPLASVILAVRNEAKFIRAAVESLLKQETQDFDLEVLVVDGMSSDGTSGIVAELMQSDRRIRLVINECQKTPYAFNLGLKEARGEYVCIFGAHTSYKQDYISVCLDELKKHGAVGCSGKIATRAADDSVGARLVSWSLSHWFGSSTRSVRTQPEGYCDTVPYPVIRKDALLAVGGYDEQLHRNQDNDMNQKLLAQGHRLYLTAKTECQYFVKPTVGALLDYAFHTGYWNVISFRKNQAAMKLRHFVPFVFVLGLLCGLVALAAAALAAASQQKWLFLPVLAVVLSHLLIGFLAAIQVAWREKSLVALLLPFVFISFHVSYGVGTLWAIVRNAHAPRMTASQHIRESYISKPDQVSL
jgi:glycosyltransferase involved in cell wall biosynthesis